MTSLKEGTLLELKEYNLQKNLLEVKNILRNEEKFEGYFETLNYSAKSEEKNSSKSLLNDKSIWNTIFVLSNKKLYLINTKENYDKISLNEISFDEIEYLNLYLKDYNEPLLELKIYGHPKIQYEPRSGNYLSLLKKIHKLKILNNKEMNNVSNRNTISNYLLYFIFIILIIALIVIYIFI